MRSWLGVSFPLGEEGLWLARRGEMGLEKGERGIAVRRKTWHHSGMQELGSKTNPCILQRDT